MGPGHPTRVPLLLGLMLAVPVLVAAACLGPDASWDTRNYHFYDPFALLNKAPGVDIAPAHLQTWFAPTQDLFFYALVRLVPNTPALNALLALPHAVAVVLATILTCRLTQARRTIDYALAGLAVAIGASGAAGGSVLATAMDDTLPASLFLLAALCLIPRDLETPPSARLVFLAGLFGGGACGFKLTFSYAAAGLALALAVVPPFRVGTLVRRLLLLAAGGLAGALLVSGYWWALQTSRYGNPLFPVYNNLFHSPLAPLESYVDPTFLPRSAWRYFEAPWAWALSLYWGVGESRLRDPRFTLAMLAAVVVLLQPWLARRLGFAARRPWAVTFLVVWFLVSFVLWRVQFSIFRYLALFELLTGTLVLLAVLPFVRRFGAERAALAGFAVLTAACAVVTVYPVVARSAPGTRPFQVEMERLPPDAMVLLLDTSPLAYLAAFQDPRVRFVGTHDWFMSLDARNPMQRLVAEAIAGHRGEIWGLDTPAEWGAQGDETLAAYRLERERCGQLVSNVSPNPVRVCRLRRGG